MGYTAIWWVRRDLRLADNQALSAAAEGGRPVLPLFVLDPALLRSPYVGAKRLAFLLEGLRSLDRDLRAIGSRLVVRHGSPAQVLRSVVAECGAQAIFAEEDYSPYARRRDSIVARHLPLHLMGGLTVHPPQALLKANGEAYVVFTPFSRAWQALPAPNKDDLLPPPERLDTPEAVSSQSLPALPRLPEPLPIRAGEAEAQRRLRAFCAGEGGKAPLVHRYAQTRDRLDLDGTSLLSPYLRFGMLSARQALVAARQALETAPSPDSAHGVAAWIRQLIWREFYLAILAHFPEARQRALRTQMQGIPWQNDAAQFEAWCAGRTGYPVVDAAMRQLAATGTMHNRARLVAASFLVKDLLIDWRWGERWFMQHLIDGDPAANNGGWQWVAGTGTDAAPYFRIFNPVSQALKFDPEGNYVRRWLPELAGVPRAFVHQPWRMPLDVQLASGCRIGLDYPAPITDHRESRQRALAAYARARQHG